MFKRAYKCNQKMQRTIFGLLLISVVIPSLAQQSVLKNHIASFSEVGFKKNKSTNVSSDALNNSTLTKEESESTVEVTIQKYAPADIDINFLPFFGSYLKTESQQIDDQMFLMDCDKSFKSRNEASDFFINMAWQYLEEGSKNNAINRFNLAWLLNNNNMDAYWGLGVIEYQTGDYHMAIKHMTKGLEISKDSNPILMVDLATIYLQIAINNPISKNESHKAHELIEKALAIQPGYTTAYMQMVLVKLLEKDEDGAWEAFHKGYALNPNEYSIQILTELLSRKSDPKGIFK